MATIAAIASPPGRAARAIVRLSGPGVVETLRAAAGVVPSGRGAHRLTLRLPRHPLAPRTLPEVLPLPALCLLSLAPRSYTGEDSAELFIPGNPHLAERVLQLLIARPGVRLAEPGEFTARAYLAGRLTLAQAEGVAQAIAADSDAQLEAARRLLSGETGARYRRLADELATLLALTEAGIDFTDQEDVVPIPAPELLARLERVGEELRGLLGPAAEERREARPVAALVGRPNAGKSTLFNALLGRARAVVSDVAGTTRDVLREDLDLSAEAPGEPPAVLLDLAGLDGALGSPVDAESQRLAREALAGADCLIHCDPEGRFDLPGLPGAPTVRVRTKADLPSGGGGGSGAIAVCALDGLNLHALRRAIADACFGAGGTRGGEAAALLPRHRRALRGALDAVAAAAGLVREDAAADPDGGLLAPELVAGSLREALDRLGEVVGEVTPDDVIGRIFASFCVGK